MIRLRRGTVVTAEERRPGLIELTCDVAGSLRVALAYVGQCGPVREGDVVVLNTTAVELGLGTGGYDFVIAVEGGPDREAGTSVGAAMKLRYTPLQSMVRSVEETDPAALDAFAGLDGAPVVLPGLHSALPAVAIGIRSVSPSARIAYVMTDTGALPLAFSDLVEAMRAAGLLDATLTAGQAFGGDLEAVNVYSAIAAARAVAGADVVVVGMGPGNLGTSSRLGFALIEQGPLVNAVAALGGLPVVVPRLSFTDPRERHRGLSHHTVTALGLAALSRATIALPPLSTERGALVEQRLASLRGRHDVVVVELGPCEQALAASPVPLRTMGRTFDEDPDPFRAAAAAGIYAALRIDR